MEITAEQAKKISTEKRQQKIDDVLGMCSKAITGACNRGEFNTIVMLEAHGSARIEAQAIDVMRGSPYSFRVEVLDSSGEELRCQISWAK